MNEDFELIKSLLNRPGSYITSISMDYLDISTVERPREKLYSGMVSISIRTAISNIRSIDYETSDKDQIKYFKTKLR